MYKPIGLQVKTYRFLSPKAMLFERCITAICLFLI